MAASGVEAYRAAMEGWARSTWEAYADLHALAREWIAEARSRRPGRRR
jgi:hypothetical protein